MNKLARPDTPPDLTPPQRWFLQAYVKHDGRVPDAAHAAGITLTEAREFLADPAVAAELAALRALHAVDPLEIVNAVADIMRHSNDDRARLAAAKQLGSWAGLDRPAQHEVKVLHMTPDAIRGVVERATGHMDLDVIDAEIVVDGD